jgi:hypothetical protein
MSVGGGSDSHHPDELELHLAYAEASIVMLECLMLKLIERGVLSADEIVEALETAIDTKRILAAEGVHPQIGKVAAGALIRVANSVAAASPIPPHKPSG